MQSINDSTFTIGGTQKPGTTSDKSNILTVNCDPNASPVTTMIAPSGVAATAENAGAIIRFTPVAGATRYIVSCTSAA